MEALWLLRIWRRERAEKGRGAQEDRDERNRGGFGMSVGLLLLLEVFYIFRGLLNLYI